MGDWDGRDAHRQEKLLLRRLALLLVLVVSVCVVCMGKLWVGACAQRVRLAPRRSIMRSVAAPPKRWGSLIGFSSFLQSIPPHPRARARNRTNQGRHIYAPAQGAPLGVDACTRAGNISLGSTLLPPRRAPGDETQPIALPHLTNTTTTTVHSKHTSGARHHGPGRTRGVLLIRRGRGGGVAPQGRKARGKCPSPPSPSPNHINQRASNHTKTHTHDKPPTAPPKKKTLLPSADDLFASIDAPAFMGGTGSAKRQADEISATRPSLHVPSTASNQPPTKRPAAAGSSSSGHRPSATTASPGKPKTGPNGMLLPPQVSRPGGRGNVVTEDVSAWTTQKKAAAAAAQKKGGEGGGGKT